MLPFEQAGQRLIWRSQSEIVQIEPWGRDSLRIRATANPSIRDDLPHALLEPAPLEVTISITSERATLSNGAISAEISAGGLIRYFDSISGAELLAETPRWLILPAARSYTYLGGEQFAIEARFQAYADEHFYGLGQHGHGRLDQKGCVVELRQVNTEVSIPFLYSSRRYGLLWNNPAIGRVELGHNGTRWVAEASRQLDYWITAGPTPSAIMANYADATGHAPLLPEWATGFWQSKNRYPSQAALLAVAREQLERGLPLAVIVIDYLHWPQHGSWQFDPLHWPDPASMVRELATMGVRVMVSVWPTLDPRGTNGEQMRQQKLLVRTERNLPAVTFFSADDEGKEACYLYDATHPAARHYIWQAVREGYYRHGITIWWLDANEPEISDAAPHALRYALGDGREVCNIYPHLHAQAFYDGMRAVGETEIITICRSAWAGSQRFGAAVWSGDIRSTFADLQIQLRAGLNMAMSGIPWWHTDVGGYALGYPAEPGFRELIVRWFQFATFTPILRLHGHRLPDVPGLRMVGAPNEIWHFGEPAQSIIRDYLLLRERLRPYILDLMRMAHLHGTPPMRPLFFEFPDQEACYHIDDAFLFGPDLLVAPILHAGAMQRQVYLPATANWTDAWTGATYAGGQWLEAAAPLERIPLYFRDNARLPIQPDTSTLL
jgi:alpha-D-xyloside xylohydrolase